MSCKRLTENVVTIAQMLVEENRNCDAAHALLSAVKRSKTADPEQFSAALAVYSGACPRRIPLAGAPRRRRRR